MQAGPPAFACELRRAGIVRASQVIPRTLGGLLRPAGILGSMDEETRSVHAVPPETEKSVRHAEDNWYAPLNRVTPLSKYLALALFVALPFAGFWLGMSYGKSYYISSVPTSSIAVNNESLMRDDPVAPENPEAATLEYAPPISIIEGTGTVLDNNMEYPTFGPFLTVKTEVGDEVYILYEFHSSDQNTACAFDAGNDFLVGDVVRFRGQTVSAIGGIALKTKAISTCDSADYYLNVLGGSQR
jgi:hypothetical protein